jgi:hypothetical protein
MEERRDMNKLLQGKVSSLGILSKPIDEFNGWESYKPLAIAIKEMCFEDCRTEYDMEGEITPANYSRISDLGKHSFLFGCLGILYGRLGMI